MCVYVFVWVSERERGRERESVCVCVCRLVKDGEGGRATLVIHFAQGCLGAYMTGV